MAEDDICDFLASWAKEFTVTIHEIIRDSKKFEPATSSKISGIVANLHIASTYIQSLPRYWIEPDLETLCRDILVQIAQICLWPEDLRYQQTFVVRDCNSALASAWAKKGRRLVKQSICKYFSSSKNESKVDVLRKNCKTLLQTLEPPGGGETRGPPPNLKQIAQHDHVEHCQAFFHILEKHCQCHSHLHNPTSCNIAWHPTRLYLDGTSRCMNFDILVSSMDMSYWQEFRLLMPSSEPSAASEGQNLAQGEFCHFLEQDICARITFKIQPDHELHQTSELLVPQIPLVAGGGKRLKYILQQYQLTPRDRIILSYAIARAYWQFYDSDLMRTRWSSESIWFMPSADDSSQQLLVEAYIPLPFGVDDEPPADFEEDINVPLAHRCPRVFALGILLLELGLAKPFSTPNRSSVVGQANFDNKVALNRLETLRKEKWGGFSHMNYFTDAIEYCLKGENFIQERGDVSTARPTRKNDPQRADVAKRRKELHDKVVLPLTYLALKGYKSDTCEKTYIKRRPGLRTSSNDPNPVSQQPQLDGAFLSGQSAYHGGWLKGLKDIGCTVYNARESKNPAPIRVAILDTGLDPNLPFYKDEDEGDDRLGVIADWKDYANPGNTSGSTDSFGHGSLMIRLVTEVCPFAKILVARVAKDTKELPRCQENISQAIKWAREQGADIISMSFGLPRSHDSILREIWLSDHKDKKRVIFLASAGNSPEEDEAFPARLPNVISIYATERSGYFLDSNAQRPSDGSYILGTFGHIVPEEIQKEFDRRYSGICAPGSSIACAVAAGISATMLAYVHLLPDLVGGLTEADRSVLKTIQTTDGMAAVFRVMALDKSDGRWFLNPAQFWRDKNTNRARYHAICDGLWTVHRKLPEETIELAMENRSAED